MKAAQKWILTGERGAGKTSLCRLLAAQARENGWDAAGVISPAIFDNGQKTGIMAVDLRGGESRPLASSVSGGRFSLPLGKWYFDPTSLEWGEQVIANSPPCDLLIVDELGPLELLQQEGWQAALAVLRGGSYHLALVVIRPELLEAARGIIDFTNTLVIDHSRSSDHWLRLYWPKIQAIPG